MKNKTVIKIAIADDHVMMRNAISTIISAKAGFNVMIEADNGKELIEQMETAETLPDICILDISMPVLNGYETLIKIKQQWPEMKVLALSMFNNEFSIIKMLRNGANGYLLKGADLKELNKALNQIHKKGFYNSELVGSNFFQMVHSPNDNPLPKITEKEIQFLTFCCSELSYKEIAQKMDVSSRTAEGYRNILFDKLNLNTRVGLVMFAINTGIVSVDKGNIN